MAAWARIRSGKRWYTGPISISDAEHTEAALNVGQGLVTLDYVVGRQVASIGRQQQLAVHQPGVGQSDVIDRLGEQFAFEIDSDDAAQMRFGFCFKLGPALVSFRYSTLPDMRPFAYFFLCQFWIELMQQVCIF